MIKGCNLKEVINFENEINKLREKLKKDENYRKDVINCGSSYGKIKSFFQEFCKFLNYIEKIDGYEFYRIRKNNSDKPFTTRKELIYPEANPNHKDRMNNKNFRVLYVSLNEYTAMAEARLDSSYINKKFQLTRFSTSNALTVYKLGMFSELYFNTDRDSEHTQKIIKNLFNENITDKLIQGYSAIECALADILYDKTEDYHILSSILADAIFSLNPSIDAIMYPSMQNRYGINLAIKKECADVLDIKYTSLNQLVEIYKNGFYKYYTKMECENFKDENNFEFTIVEGNCIYR
ncbi:RES domain-containing protein [Arcobacter sp. L]|uniref:RES domain-containing protein n=1 Tax=Arcobacter sp. L TaxID=944547 RepID=UPI000229645E|nr:RES domain-containing protein [Arcobacter sp. L]BAK73176.1 hypothetical protein ABLL_1301 [Arcobacter sp. L]